MFIADFHIHSKYSRATSRECVPEVLALWARRKGLHVIGTGDFTHPAWRKELKEKLVPAGEGLYTLKNDFCQADTIAGADFKPQFIVSGEISSIYKKNGRVRKVHNLILLPGLEPAETIARKLETIGNLHSDGRPILGLDSRDLLEIVLDACPEAIFIPAHIWTPHFSLYGAYSGFDDITECFGDLTGYIYALETGLSSNPPMNWRLSALDNFALVSNSDAHSPANLAREANIFDTGLSYPCLLQALKNRGTKEFYGTIEFFPEEGKYHYDGHRNCKVCWQPSATKAAGGICPVCGGRLTVGVLHRVEALADRAEGFMPPAAKHFESLVPLYEIIASSIGATVASMKVKQKYDGLLQNLGPELFVLREASLQDIELVAGPCIAEGIRRLRAGQVDIQPGFDGEYGKVKVMDKSEIDMFSGQLCFMNDQILDDTDNCRVEAAMPVAIAASQASVAEAEPVRNSTDACLPGDNERAVQAAVEFPYGLNKEQWEAVSAAEPAMAVIAGPGTGKTKTLVCRIAYLVEQCGVHPSQITAVTFTNKAAKEMRHRLEQHFGNKRTAGAMTIGTFHSICLQMLSRWRGKHNVTIMDEYNALAIIEEIIKDMNVAISPRAALKEISLRKNTAPSIGDEQNPDILDRVYDAYCSQLKSYGVMDYDDILLEVLHRFEYGNGDDTAGGRTENSCSYLLVDEFQDINEPQYRLIKAWGRTSESIFIIGDPDQSIYGFRGSDFRYFAKFAAEFPGIRHIRLRQNYRSTPEVIAAAWDIIQKSAEESACSLAATRESGAKVRLIETNDEFAEAIFVAKEINRMVGGIDMLDTQVRPAARKAKAADRQLRGFADIAVLYRTNRQAEVLEQCFIKEGIPYVVAGRDEFLAERSVREALAFFKFLLNPGDIASLLMCLKANNSYSPEVSRTVLNNYAAGKKDIPTLAKLLAETPEAFSETGDSPHFIDMVERYASVIHTEKPWRIIDSWLGDNNLSGVRCMELLLHMSVTHDDMSSFIQNLALGRESDIVRSGSKVYSPDAVTLMTLHAAKGLEFPVTFICGVNDGLMPLRNTGSELDMEEERRLFYVGVTRARDELILLTSRVPSPFVADIAKEQLIREKGFKHKQAPQYTQDCLFAADAAKEK